MKEYKYRQYKLNIPLQDNSELIKILDTYPTHTRNGIIIEALQNCLILGATVHKQSGGTEDCNMSAADKSLDAQNREERQYNNDKVIKMLEILTEKVQKLESREGAKVEERREYIADKIMPEAEQDMPHRQKKTADSVQADKEEKEITPEVSTEVLDFLNALGNG